MTDQSLINSGMNSQSSCGCCEGTEPLTPLATANRPGLNSLAYRAGTHATFLETMKARLSGLYLDIPRNEVGADGKLRVDRIYPLRGLTTRDANDPAIALLDAWATVGDVLTFYQERIANEGYLRTATERRSVLELVRLISYALRPGVSASAFFALTMEKDGKIKLNPNELRAQSVPGPGELPQAFENSETLDARVEWNKLSPRMTRPQTIGTIGKDRTDRQTPGSFRRLYLKGISTNLKANDPLLIDFDGSTRELFRVIEVIPDTTADRTLVKMNPWKRPSAVRRRIASLQKKMDELIARISPRATHSAIQQALDLIGGLQEKIDEETSEEGLATFIRGTMLIPLAICAKELSPRATVIGPLLNEIITNLETAADDLEAAQIMETVEVGSGNGGDSNTPRDMDEDCDAQGDELAGVIAGLIKPGSIPPRSSARLMRDVQTSFAIRADAGLQMLGAFHPVLAATVQTALTNLVTPRTPIRVYALRVTAAPFGHNAPLRSIIQDNAENARQKLVVYEEWELKNPRNEQGTHTAQSPHKPNTLFLDAEYKIQPNSWIAILKQDGTQIILTLGDNSVRNESLAAYGISGKSTRLDLGTNSWIDIDKEKFLDPAIRKTIVLGQSEELALAEEPIDNPICGGEGPEGELELDSLLSDLKPGRWLIISGERTDIETSFARAEEKKIPGVTATELVMLATVEHRFNSNLPGDKVHTFIRFAKKLAYCYKRDTVTIYGNVVKANHGETRNEPLGGGDATKPFQSFTLRQPPLTYVTSPTPAGAESTLKVFVNNVQWHETDALAELTPLDRKFVTRTDDDGKTTIVFGNGERGARLPTGIENIRATYRNGIGKVGNVRAEQISLLATRPAGVKEVINPMRASGGADKESRDQARKNAPLTVTALDRLISTEDYADFARTFAGIGKSVAARFSDGRRELVHVTIAGVDDIPIDESSDLFHNLAQALRRFGDSFQPFKVEVRELKFLILSAKVRILPDYLWEPVAADIRARLLETFSFEQRELGQDALLSEAISAMQSVKGVGYVDVDVFGGVSEKKAEVLDNVAARRLLTPNEILTEALKLTTPAPRVRVNMAGLEEKEKVIRPAQLAYLTPDVPETLILNQI